MEYARRGWHVFPAPPGEKRSYLRGADHGGARWGASAHPETVRAQFERFPHANIGIATEESDIVVLDLDRKDGRDGVAWLEEEAARHGGWPVTIEAESPTGGRHLYFRAPEGIELKTCEGLIAPGVDLRACGGMVVAPPSVKPGVGTYRWVNPPPMFEPVDVPGWLLPRLPRRGPAERPADGPHVVSGGADGRAERWAAKALQDEIASVLAAPEGERNATLNRAAYALGQIVAGGGLDAATVRGRLTAAARGIGLARDETDRTIASGLAAGKREPRGPKERERPGDADGLRGWAGGGGGGGAGASGAETDADAAPETERPRVRPTLYPWPAPSAIPPREWLYGEHLIRGFASLTVAPGGLGKTSLGTAEALAMASGRSTVGAPPTRPLRVWMWNGEDPADEIYRRIAAASLHYGISADDVGDRLFADSGRAVPIKLVTMDREGAKVARPLIEDMVAAITEHAVDVLIVDPFVTTHEVPENDNGAINAAVAAWREIADRTGCAVELYHHTQKGAHLQGGDLGIAQSRGASSLIDGVRSARFLVRMTEEEGEKAGVDNHRLFFRVEVGKANLAPAPDKATWRRLVSVHLGNGSDLYPDGDSIGVCTAWEWPDAFEDVSAADLEEVSRRLAAAEDDLDGQENEQAARWAGYVVADVLNLDCGPRKKSERSKAHAAARAKVRAVLRTWIDNGALVRTTRRDLRNGRDIAVLRPAGSEGEE